MGYLSRIHRHPNVICLPRIYDMNALYARDRLLLVASVVEVAFPRVITEAGLAGLSALGSSRGGIPDAIGPCALLVPYDDPWGGGTRPGRSV